MFRKRQGNDRQRMKKAGHFSTGFTYLDRNTPKKHFFSD